MGCLPYRKIEDLDNTHNALSNMICELKKLKTFIEKNSWEEDFPRYTADCHPPRDRVIFSDVVIEFIDEIINRG